MPHDIPVHPYGAYAKDGWSNWSDWLGTATVASYLREYRSFKKARDYVRSLGLTKIEWRNYCKSRDFPKDIPLTPSHVYAQQGWTGMNDWLGLHRFRSFKAARVFVRRLGLKSATEWRSYCKSGKKPTDIPSAPYAAYAKDGWSDWGDWLGTETVATSAREYRSFKKARAYVRRLGLKSNLEWREYCKSGNKPVDIPAHADRSYAQSGWAGMADWLGYVH